MYITLYEPKSENYKKLIDIAFKICDKFGFVRHSQLSYYQSVDILINELNEEFIEYREQTEWPGTISVPSATVYYFRTTEKSKKIIMDSCNSLFDWRSPYLPDDLFFFKNEKVWLINTAHEYICGIETDDIQDLEEIGKHEGLIYDIAER